MCSDVVKYVCAVVLCSICVNAISLDNTKTPLSVSNPISGPPEKTKDLKREESRFSDPAPEYYKGHPSSASLSRDRDRYGFQTSDIAEHRYDGGSSTNAIPYGSSGYGGSRYSSSGYGSSGSRDRISVGGYYGNSGIGTTGYGYDRPRGPYGPAQTVDLPGGGGGYYSGYGSHGLDYGQSGYGGGYGQGQDMWTEKLHHLSKSNLIPIASAALLGIAAAFIFNPVLLQLGTISAGKRRRRDTTTQIEQTLSNDSKYSQDMAYKGQNNKR